MTQILEKRLVIADGHDVVVARVHGVTLAKDIGFDIVDQTKIGIVISEVARNIIDHAREGIIELRSLHCSTSDSDGMEIVAMDDGPGIVDIAQALEDGYSTNGGMGAGLGAVSRLMDECEVESEIGTGTTVWARKWMQDKE